MVDIVLITKIDSESRLVLLEQTLRTLALNTNFDLVNRIVWVDDCSSLDINGEFIDLASKNTVFYKSDVRLGVGGAKNKGVDIHTKQGRGNYIYFTDADVYFTPMWLDRLIDVYTKEPDFKILGAGVHPYLQPRNGEQTEYLTSHDAMSGWSFFLSYETWDKYGRLADNALGTGQSEDWEYCQRVRNDGYKVGCLNPQFVAHTGMTNTEGNSIGGRSESEILAKKVAGELILL